MMLHLPLCKSIEDFAIEPWMTRSIGEQSGKGGIIQASGEVAGLDAAVA